MSAAKNDLKNSTISQEFILMRSEYDLRVNQLERDVYECVRILNKIKSTKNLRAYKNQSEAAKFLTWEFNMKDFPVENITIQLKDGHVYLLAYKNDMDIKREICMPENVDKSKISAILTMRGILTISVPIVLPLSDKQKLMF
ncbi:uncharacterized protein LOC128262092 [Drosophila gunungcola]|uniref:uncharacterized protein LOC128262092 n=1 Tax=Drosophila gunungcola TaxID=103775 RepID=UPI0022E74E6E|nr:uncharacterized protein LOC128262092 [Drosophila gunungcola]